MKYTVDVAATVRLIVEAASRNHAEKQVIRYFANTAVNVEIVQSERATTLLGSAGDLGVQ